MLKVKIFTLFPETFPGTLGISIPAKALKEKKWDLTVVDIKKFGIGKRCSVDDYPFGGGSGMLIRADVLGNALESELSTETLKPVIILTSARGHIFSQEMAIKFSAVECVYIICGRFEGIDERFIEYYNALEVSLGKFVLFGGEVAAMTILEASIRVIDGVLGCKQTLEEESYTPGSPLAQLMEYPQYTNPRIWKGIEVPAVILSGNHASIKKWRLEKAGEITAKYKHSIDHQIY